jgi:hypothetical protein
MLLNEVDEIFVRLHQLLHSLAKNNIIKITLNKLTISFQLIDETFLIDYLLGLTTINATGKMFDNKRINEVSPDFMFKLLV